MADYWWIQYGLAAVFRIMAGYNQAVFLIELGLLNVDVQLSSL
ncbi:hypothetical protein [Novipirellula caenicola]